mmetsp:Transcript_13213/g.31077  ORF Transcript_13213/g.31077 Transcript_13213/m.31077 type:complete len:102 (-) Transcript_13213:174-479(-)
MNALFAARRTISAVPRATAIANSRRKISSRQVIDDIKNKPIWLEDPSTYPVIATTIVACALGTSYFLYIQTCKNYIRWSPSKRCSEIRWWGDDKADLRVQK